MRSQLANIQSSSPLNPGFKTEPNHGRAEQSTRVGSLLLSGIALPGKIKMEGHLTGKPPLIFFKYFTNGMHFQSL